MKKIMMGDINSGKLGGVDNITLFCEKGDCEYADIGDFSQYPCNECEIRPPTMYKKRNPLNEKHVVVSIE